MLAYRPKEKHAKLGLHVKDTEAKAAQSISGRKRTHRGLGLGQTRDQASKPTSALAKQGNNFCVISPVLAILQRLCRSLSTRHETTKIAIARCKKCVETELETLPWGDVRNVRIAFVLLCTHQDMRQLQVSTIIEMSLVAADLCLSIKWCSVSSASQASWRNKNDGRGSGGEQREWLVVLSTRARQPTSKIASTQGQQGRPLTVYKGLCHGSCKR